MQQNPWLTSQERLSVLSRMDKNLGGIRFVRAFAAQRHEPEKFDRQGLSDPMGGWIGMCSQAEEWSCSTNSL
ncbi:hypothetical protein MesoLjLa_68060 (plasmid) [Mesorhizobium sp. L-2-11]|nr:hypothetical protein MesoLjLa_68060 [Mesorhizobium sp. L-2-11]